MNSSGGKRTSEKRRSQGQGTEKTRNWQKKAEKEEKKQKQEEKAAKGAEQQRIAEEKGSKKVVELEGNEALVNNLSTKKPPKEKSTEDQRLQGCEIPSSECAAWFRLYEDDVNDDGDVTCDSHKSAVLFLWMHTTNLDGSDGRYICAVCQNMLC